MSTHESIIHAGRAAYYRGESVANNPHAGEGLRSVWWLDGWNDARRDANEQPLAPWERELLDMADNLGYGTVVFQRTDERRVTIENVRVDSIGPSAEQAGVVGLEQRDGTVRHLPFIESWTIEYD